MRGAEHGSDGSLKSLGPGGGSKVERIKLESNGLSGSLREELRHDAARFADPTVQLLKFHGVYQQEDRDVRLERKAAGAEKAYMMMVRSRIPGGALTAQQYLVEDALADRYGNGTLRITTRQGLQLHGVLKGDLHATIHAINEALLSTLAACGDVNRNVMACPAPATTAAQAHLQQIAHQIAMHLAPRASAYHEIWVDGEQVRTVEAPTERREEPIYGLSYLPRKFKIGIAAPGDNCIDIFTQDIGLAAHIEDEQLLGFTVLVGGGMGMTHGKTETFPRLATPLCFVTPEETIEVVETIVTIQRDYGDRQNRKHARMKYLVEERGIAWFRAETERRLKRFLCSPRPVRWQAAHDHLGWHEQADGRWYLGLLVENGRIQDTDALPMRTALRRVMKQFAPGVRLTAQQNILLTDIQAADREALSALLAEHGISDDPDAAGHVRRHALACPALPTCGLALADAERALPAVVTRIEEAMAELGLAGEPLSVRMTGCPNGCARPFMGDIGFVGRTRDVYNLYIGGDWANTRLNTLYAASVRLEDLASTVRPLLEIWRDERHDRESFGDFAHRWGPARLRDYVEQGQTA